MGKLCNFFKVVTLRRKATGMNEFPRFPQETVAGASRPCFSPGVVQMRVRRWAQPNVKYTGVQVITESCGGG